MSIRRTMSLAAAVLGLSAISGCEPEFAAFPEVINDEINEKKEDEKKEGEKKKEAEGCRVTGRIISNEWRKRGGGIERAIVTALKVPDSTKAADLYAKGESFEFQLPPGKYRLSFSAVGTSGATFNGQTREIVVDKDQKDYEIGEIDLPISKSTGLYGHLAPELTGIIAWQNTPPISIKDLKGKVIVLDFFAYYCTICHAHKPDLEKLHNKYERDGLVVLAIHDSSLKTLDEMNAKMDPVLLKVFNGNPPKIPMALDGAGANSVFDAYGIYAVPAVILIDQRGRIVRRYHHAGKSDLEEDVRALLSVKSQRIP